MTAGETGKTEKNQENTLAGRRQDSVLKVYKRFRQNSLRQVQTLTKQTDRQKGEDERSEEEDRQSVEEGGNGLSVHTESTLNREDAIYLSALSE